MAAVKLEGNADAVEFCPTPPYFNVLAAATYTLQEASTDRSALRSGTLSLFTFPRHGDLELRRTHLLHTCGVLDIKWRPPSSCSPDPPFLAQAGSDGSLTLYNLQEVESCMLSELLKDTISSSMCLSLDWNPFSKENISVSHSDGSLTVVNIRESHVEVTQHRGSAHSFEAWCVCYDSWKSDIIYSGGDDCCFCCWDVRQGLSEPVFRERKMHHMGVCSIQSNPHEENYIVTGSYDEKLRIWDTRQLSQPIVETALELGGGVWKVKWCPFDKDLIATACMHNGLMVLKVGRDEIVVVSEYKNHESLAYGVDWYKGPSKGSISQLLPSNSVKESRNAFDEDMKSLHPLVASCSFYDRSLQLWTFDL